MARVSLLAARTTERCPRCGHELDAHRTVYRALGAGAGRTLAVCGAVRRGQRCRCEREIRQPEVPPR